MPRKKVKVVAEIDLRIDAHDRGIITQFIKGFFTYKDGENGSVGKYSMAIRLVDVISLEDIPDVMQNVSRVSQKKLF